MRENVFPKNYFWGIWLYFLGIVLLCNSCHNKYKPDFNFSSDFGKAMEEADSQLQLWGNSSSIARLDSAFYTLGPLTVRDSFEYYRFKHNYYWNHYRDLEKCAILFDSLYRLIIPYEENIKAAGLMTLMYYMAGDLAFRQKDYKTAYKNYFSARLLGQQNLDLCTLADYSYRLAMILYQQERFMEAMLYFQEALNRCQQCDFKRDPARHYFMQENYSNVALCYGKLHMTDSAIWYYKKALEYQEQSLPKKNEREKAFYKICQAVVWGNLAQEYATMGMYDTAEHYYLKSILTNMFYKREIVHAMQTTIQLAKMYYDMGEFQKMHYALMETKNVLDSMPNLHTARWWNYYMAKYYDAMKNYDTAYFYFNNYEKLRDSTDKSYQSLRTSDVNVHLKNIEREQEIILLEKNNQRKQWFLAGSLIIVAICIAVVAFIIHSMRRVKRYVAMLGKANKRINNQKIALKTTLIKLEKSNQQKDKILRVVAHDLRSPIAAINALTDLCLMEESLTDSQKEYINLIKAASEQALTLSNEILDSTAIINETSLRKEETSVGAVVAQQVELLRFKAEEKEQKIEVSLPTETIMAHIDKEKFSRVVNNLVANALKFSPKNSVIRIGLTRQNQNFLLTVQDSGIGIPDELKDKVFDMFTTAKRVGTEGEKPFGLGLSISKQIVQAHKGSIWFDSEENKGTIFYVSIPC